MMLQSLSKMKTGDTKSFSGYLLTVSTHTDMNSFVSDSVPTFYISNHIMHLLLSFFSFGVTVNAEAGMTVHSQR